MCVYKRQQKIESLTLRAEAKAKDLAAENKIPKPKVCPVNFEDFLRLTIGGRSKSRRIKIYRDYAKDMIWIGHVRQLTNPKNPADKLSKEEAERIAKPASPDEIEMWMEAAKIQSYATEDRYIFAARIFMGWLARRPSELARKAAIKRWSKSKKSTP